MRVETQKIFPRWQAERSTVLQRACISIKSAVQRGQGLGRMIRRTARRLHGRPYKAAPQRTLKLSAVSLRRAWDKWRRSGELPAAFKLNFHQGNGRQIPAPVLVRFVNFCADRNFPNYAAALRAFNAGPRRVSVKQRPLAYDSVRKALPKNCFRELKRWIAAQRQAELELQKLRLRFVAEIESRVPAKTPRRRATPDFQI